MNSDFQLLVWSGDGRLVLSTPLRQMTMAISGRPDSDIELAELGDETVFVRLETSLQGASSINLLRHGSNGGEEQTIGKMGELLSLGSLSWMVLKPANDAYNKNVHASDEPEIIAHSNYLRELITWLAKPMSQSQELRDSLKDFLALTVEHTAARSGLLVLAQRSETPRQTPRSPGYAYTLISSCGLDPQEVERLWDKMPASLPEEILRHKAKVLLPEEMRRRVSSDSTVFIRGIRSLVGFPVLAEDRLVAVFYVGFDNLMRQLSPELQGVLEAAADLLGIVIQRASLREQLENEKLLASASSVDSTLPSGRLMVGSSQRLVNVYRTISRLSPVDVPVLILGETGTGKELAAKELHRLSPRAKKPFVVVNAAALPETLIESELFGHKKGAFTGALSDRIGLVEQAAGGTLFIDEIGELALAMQAKLLRVLQERSVTRIGETTPRPIDFRLLCATHRNLEEMVGSGTFREDLFYRIAGATVTMPALRERTDDIVTLANYFRKQFAERHGLIEKEWSADALVALEENTWPGNIRELENVVSRAFVMAEGPVIRRSDLGLASTQQQNAAISGAPGASRDPYLEALAEDAVGESLTMARDHWMKNFLARALKRHNGKRAETAKALGIGERTLFRYIEQFDIRDE